MKKKENNEERIRIMKNRNSNNLEKEWDARIWRKRNIVMKIITTIQKE